MAKKQYANNEERFRTIRRGLIIATVASVALVALLLPLSLQLPRWLEAEAVLLVWWALFAITLTTLLYRGWRLKDDPTYAAPWNKPSKASGGSGGLGFLVYSYNTQIKIPALFATALTSCLLGFIFVAAVAGLNWAVLHKWHDSFERNDH